MVPPSSQTVIERNFEIAIEAVAALLEDDRAGRGEFHGGGDAEQDRRDEGEDEQREDDVADAFDDAVGAGNGVSQTEITGMPQTRCCGPGSGR